MAKVEHLYIIDAHAQIHRAYHTPMRPLSGPPGSCEGCGGDGNTDEQTACEACLGTGREPTGVTHLFLKVLDAIVTRRKPSYMAICYDGPRHELKKRKISKDYKRGRGETPAALIVQAERIKQVVKLLGVAGYQLPGYEADDLIATLATKCVSDEVHVRIVSKDKDMGCLLSDPRIMMYDTNDDMEIGPEWIRRRFKVEPCQMEDYLTLVGDATDGISGVRGIGPKNAVALLKEFGTLDNILGAPQSLSPRLRDLTDPEVHPELVISQQLVQLNRAAPMQFKARDLECNGLDFRAALPILKRLGFKQWGSNETHRPSNPEVPASNGGPVRRRLHT